MNKHTLQQKVRILMQTGAMAIFIFVPQFVAAQTGGDRVTVNLSDPARPALVRAGLLNGGITVKVSDNKEIVVEARVRGRETQEMSQGNMRRLPSISTGLTVEEENNQVRISTDSVQRTVDLILTVPRQTSLRLRTTNDGDITVNGVEGEIDVNNTNGEVTLTNISGSVVAHALNGRVHATFARVNAQKPMAFSSFNGNIDVTFPADLKANISLRSDNGDVFSDFDVQLQSGGVQPIVEDSRKNSGKYRVKIDKTIRGTIGGGGVEIQFTNYQGNIYIRKAGAAR